MGGEAGSQSCSSVVALVQTRSPAHPWAPSRLPHLPLKLHQEAYPDWGWLNRPGRAGWRHLCQSSCKLSRQPSVPLPGRWSLVDGVPGSVPVLLAPAPRAVSGSLLQDCPRPLHCSGWGGPSPLGPQPLCTPTLLHALGRAPELLRWARWP